MSEKVNIAAVQMDPRIMEKSANLEKMLHEVKLIAAHLPH